MARLVLPSSGRYTASAPAFLSPSTIGPTSVVPKSTAVLRYTGSRPDALAAYFWVSLATPDDDGEMPYPTDPILVAPSCFATSVPLVKMMPVGGGLPFPPALMMFSLPFTL